MFKKILFLVFPIAIFAQEKGDLKKAAFLFSKSVNDSAIFYFEKGFKDCINCKTIEIANYYLQYAEAKKIEGKGEITLGYIVKAEKIFTKLVHYEGLVNAKITKAELYRFLDKEKKGIIALQEAKIIIDQHPISKKILARYYDRKIALTEKTKETAFEIIQLCKKTLELAKEIDDYKLQFSILNEMGYTYPFLETEKQKAKKSYEEALQIARKYDLKYETCDVLYTLGIHTLHESVALKQAGKRKKSIQIFKEYEAYHKEALKLATQLNYKVKQKDISYFLYIGYREFKQYKEAMEYSDITYKYEIEQLKNAKAEEVAEIEGKYNTETKDIAIKQQKSKITTQYIGLFLLGISLILLFYFLKKSKKDKINIELQKEEIEEILSQKTILLKEVHHRVKNNLQVISSLLYLQSNKFNSPEIKEMVTDSQKHINSIALVHEMLYQDSDLSSISMNTYFKELGTRMLQLASNKNITYKITTNKIYLPIDYATPLGLILNELVTNSIKYAFNNEDGEIYIILEEVAINKYKFIYKDNGVGMDVSNSKISNSSLGIKLIKMFADEMDADLKIESNNGLSYSLLFKKKPSKNG